MSEKINDGGPAFPMPRGAAAGKHNDSQQGMSLRDWFAGMALQGYRSRVDCLTLSPEAASECSFKDADAMLAEREKGKQP